MDANDNTQDTANVRDLYLHEYEGLIEQIIHWDSHFWTKSQFFLVVESAFIAVIVQALREEVNSPTRSPFALLCLLIFLGFFNIYLCYVWYRTNRRNREFLRLRFERAREIETALGGVMRTFINDKERLPKGHGSATWETHLAMGFIIVWIVLLIVTIILVF